MFTRFKQKVTFFRGGGICLAGTFSFQVKMTRSNSKLFGKSGDSSRGINHSEQHREIYDEDRYLFIKQ